MKNIKSLEKNAFEKGFGFREPNMENVDKGLCAICGDKLRGSVVLDRRSISCGSECHEIFVKFFESIAGRFKQITHMETGISYKVPTRVVIEDGIKGEDLDKYPLWDGNPCE